MNKTSLKETKTIEKTINKSKDFKKFNDLKNSKSYEQFIIETTRRDYFNNLNFQNKSNRGSESSTGIFLMSEIYKNGIEAVKESMERFINKKARQTNISRFFMSNTTYLNIEETNICEKSVKSSVIIATSIMLNYILHSNNYELLESKELCGFSNYVKLSALFRLVGVAILEEQIINSIIIQQPELSKSLLNRVKGEDVFQKFNQLATNNNNINCILKNGLNKNGEQILNVNPNDKNNDLSKIGAFFVMTLVGSSDIFEVLEVNKKPSMITLSEKFLENMKDFEDFKAVQKPKNIPKPIRFGKLKPWTDFSGGCFNHININFIKKSNKSKIKKLKKEDYEKTFEMANYLQDSPFSINETVFKTIKNLVNSDQRFRNSKGKLILPFRAGNLSSEIPKLPIHLEELKDEIKLFIKMKNEYANKKREMSNKPVKFPVRLTIESKSQKFQKAFKEYKEFQIKVRLENEFLKSNASKYSALVQSLDIANMLGDESFYIPVNVCWRLRYYYASVLNPQTSDSTKGLLQSGKTEYITEESDFYMFYNCGANDFGLDKIHPDLKRKWVLENIEKIAACGEDPLNPENLSFWGEADKPFMFLNFCSEIAQLLKNDMKFLNSRYLCGFDGSCNGSQHWGAITGDRDTALLTNLTNDTERHDLYAVVAKYTQEIIEGIKSGKYKETITINTKYGDVTIKIKDYYKDQSEELLQIGISREMVKQNVMTMTYGSTPFGRRLQVESVFKGYVSKKVKLPFSSESFGFKASLISNVAQCAIAKANPGPVMAMKWLEDCMEVFNDVIYTVDETTYKGLSPTWKICTGATIIQEYFDTKPESIRFKAGTKEIRIYTNKETTESKKSKHVQGIIANVTHAQDGAHMTLTGLECKKFFDIFVCVHDSFITSVKNASKLFNIVRYKFAEMYEGDFLQDLYNQWFEQIEAVDHDAALNLPKPPLKGTFDIKESVHSLYSFI